MDLKELSKSANKKDLDRILLKDYVQALKDDDFKKLVSRVKIKEDVAMKYTSKLEETVKELRNCSKCPGLSACKNPVEGCVNYPTLEENRVRFNYVACKYQKEKIENEKNSAVTFEEPLAIKNAKMSEIDLRDKNRIDVIKWVKNFYKEYQKNPHIKGMYLHGSFGSGKTYILAALLNELAKGGAKTIILHYPEMLIKLKESFDDDFSSLMNQIKKCDILLIDDIGAESVSVWSRDEILGTILQYRMDACLPTFFTSNLNIEALETHLANTKNGVELLKAKRIIERVKYLTEDFEMISKNRRV